MVIAKKTNYIFIMDIHTILYIHHLYNMTHAKRPG